MQYLLVAGANLWLIEAEAPEAAVAKWMDDHANPYARFNVYEIGEYLGNYGLPQNQIKKLNSKQPNKH